MAGTFYSDYNDEEALSRFLLNPGRSYVSNFQDKKERARNAGIEIDLIPTCQVQVGFEEAFTNPAKMNLKHARNTSVETPALIGLAQTYFANPVLFTDFQEKLASSFQSEPAKNSTNR